MSAVEERLAAAMRALATDAEAAVTGARSEERLRERLEGTVAVGVIQDESPARHPIRRRLLLTAAAAILAVGALAGLGLVGPRSVPAPESGPGGSLPWMLKLGWVPPGFTAAPDYAPVDPRILGLDDLGADGTGVGYRIEAPAQSPVRYGDVLVGPAEWRWGANTEVRRDGQDVPATWTTGRATSGNPPTLRWTDPSGVDISVTIYRDGATLEEAQRIASGLVRVDRRTWESTFAQPVAARGEVDGLRWLRLRGDTAANDRLAVWWDGRGYEVGRRPATLAAPQVVTTDLPGAERLVVPWFGAGCRLRHQSQAVERELPRLPDEAGALGHLYLLRPAEASVEGIQLAEAGWFESAGGVRSGVEPDLTGHCRARGNGWSALYPGFPE